VIGVEGYNADISSSSRRRRWIRLSFYRHLISEVARSIVTKLFATCSMMKISQKFGRTSHNNFGGPKTSKFRRDGYQTT